MIVPVNSASDPRLAPYLSVKERDLIRRDARFIVEGKVTVARLIEDSRFPVESLFLADTRLEPLHNLLAQLDPAVPVYAAPQAVMDQVAGFHLHRGVLALARRTPHQTTDQLLATLPPLPLVGRGRAQGPGVGGTSTGADPETQASQQQTLLVLIGLSNHDNVGACFRNASALGASAILLDDTSCDPLYRKAIRVSAGTALSLPFARSGDGASIIAALKTAGFACWALSPTAGAPIQTLAPPPRLALILGAEGPGLPESLMTAVTRVSIPMSPGVDSLNVATAGAIALSHVYGRRALA